MNEPATITFRVCDTRENDFKYTVYIKVNEETAGSLELYKFFGEDYEIGYGKIYESFKGQKLYGKLLKGALMNLPNCRRILSDDRNKFSQACYEHWIGHSFYKSDRIWIYYDADIDSLRFKFDTE